MCEHYVALLEEAWQGVELTIVHALVQQSHLYLTWILDFFTAFRLRNHVDRLNSGKVAGGKETFANATCCIC